MTFLSRPRPTSLGTLIRRELKLGLAVYGGVAVLSAIGAVLYGLVAFEPPGH